MSENNKPKSSIQKTISGSPTEKPLSSFNEGNRSSVKAAFSLPKSTILVEHIDRASMLIIEQNRPNHVYNKGIGPRSKLSYQLPPNPNNPASLINPFSSKEEQTYLEKVLGLQENELSTARRDSPYWSTYWITLNKSGKILHLDNPTDYLMWKVLLTLNNLVAKSPELANTKKTYRFVLKDLSYDADLMNLNMSKMSKAYSLYGELEGKFETLKQIVIEHLGNRIPEQINSINFIIKTIKDIIQNTPDRFIELASDKDLSYKSIVSSAIEYNIIKRKGELYYDIDGTPLCLSNDVNNKEGFIRFLKDDNSQTFVSQMMLRIETAKEAR